MRCKLCGVETQIMRTWGGKDGSTVSRRHECQNRHCPWSGKHFRFTSHEREEAVPEDLRIARELALAHQDR